MTDSSLFNSQGEHTKCTTSYKPIGLGELIHMVKYLTSIVFVLLNQTFLSPKKLYQVCG